MKKIIKEFKEFISRGNVVDLAVGVIIGGAFTGIVNSLVNDIIMPVIGVLTGGTHFESLKLTLLGDAAITYGAFISAVLNFFIIALVVFLLVKVINSFRRKKDEPAPEVEPARLCPFCRQEIPRDATRCCHCTSQLEE